ncbi:MAG TPA: hypothetical protein VHT04_05070 [Stellaceae bacterium]|jgi:hypothetical protein|nr:hypothetical protein [Stellaceae bacterium]
MRGKTIGIRAGLALLAVLFTASGCASGARTDAMAVAVSPDTVIGNASKLRGAVRVDRVSGGAETNPLWHPNVSTDNFRAALGESLTRNGMTSSGQGSYLLNAELVSLDRPLAAFDTTVTAKVHYTVVATGSQAIKLDETIETPYTVKFSETVYGPERFRLANEGAMHDNIEAILKRMITAAQPGGPF